MLVQEESSWNHKKLCDSSCGDLDCPWYISQEFILVFKISCNRRMVVRPTVFRIYQMSFWLSIVVFSVSKLSYFTIQDPCVSHLAWRAPRPWGRQTRWDQQPGIWSGWRPLAGGAGPGWWSWFFPAFRGRGQAVTTGGSCLAAETTGWHRAGRAHSKPPPAGSPGGTGWSQQGGKTHWDITRSMFVNVIN